MKRLPVFGVTAAFLLLFSCEPELTVEDVFANRPDTDSSSTQVDENAPEITVSVESLLLEAAGGTGSLSFTLKNPSKDGVLKGKTDQKWIHDIEVGDGSLSFVYDANGYTDRKANISVCYTGVEDVVIPVVQTAADRPAVVFELSSTDTLEVPVAGGSYEIAYVLENPVEDVEVKATSDDGWISGITVGESSVSFTAAATTLYEVRVGKVVLSYASLSLEAIVKQAALEHVGLAISATSANYEAEGGEGSFTWSVETEREGAELSISSDADWLTFTLDGSTVTYTVAASKVEEERTGTLTLNYGDESVTFTVTQAAYERFPHITGTFASAFQPSSSMRRRVSSLNGTHQFQANDIISVQLRGKEGASHAGELNKWEYITNESGSTVSFVMRDDKAEVWESTASAIWDIAEYAFIPKTGNTANNLNYNETGNTSGKEAGSVTLSTTIYPDASDATAVLPYIGLRQTDTYTYVFSPATATVSVTFTNIPSTARQAVLEYDDASAYPLSGDFSFGEDCVILAENVVGSSSAKKVLAFTSSLFSSQTFLFPIPVGTLPAGLYVRLYDVDGDVVGEASFTETITLSQGATTDLGSVLCSDNVKNIVAQSGNADARKIYLEAANSALGSLKIALNTDRTAAVDAVAASSLQLTQTGEANGIVLNDQISSSGKYYLAYRAYNVDGDAMDEDVTVDTLCLITSADATKYAITYTATYDSSSQMDGSSSYNNVVKFAVSDDLSKGNIMLTHFLGRSYDLTDWATGTGGSTAGSPCYGLITPDGITFTHQTGETPFFTAHTGAVFALAQGEEGSFIGYASHASYDIVFNYTTEDGNILSNESYIYLKYSNDNGSNWGRLWAPRYMKLAPATE